MKLEICCSAYLRVRGIFLMIGLSPNWKSILGKELLSYIRQN